MESMLIFASGALIGAVVLTLVNRFGGGRIPVGLTPAQLADLEMVNTQRIALANDTRYDGHLLSLLGVTNGQITGSLFHLLVNLFELAHHRHVRVTTLTNENARLERELNGANTMRDQAVGEVKSRNQAIIDGLSSTRDTVVGMATQATANLRAAPTMAEDIASTMIDIGKATPTKTKLVAERDSANARSKEAEDRFKETKEHLNETKERLKESDKARAADQDIIRTLSGKVGGGKPPRNDKPEAN